MPDKMGLFFTQTYIILWNSLSQDVRMANILIVLQYWEVYVDTGVTVRTQVAKCDIVLFRSHLCSVISHRPMMHV